MTIPAGNNWCPTCSEACHGHPSICTVCGSNLVAPPSPRGERGGRRGRAGVGAVPLHRDDGAARVPVVPDHLVEDARRAGRELRSLLQNLRQQIQSTGAAQDELMAELQSVRRGWEQLQRNRGDGDDAAGLIPPAWLDPQQQQARNRPTSKEALDQIPRIRLEENSYIFQKASIAFRSTTEVAAPTLPLPHMEALLGEFGIGTSVNGRVPDARLVVAKPLTGKGGRLSTETTSQLADKKDGENCILYMERGDGVTFAQKALMAQRAGASACVIGNNISQPWPYVMKDSKREAVGRLSIPTVMVRQEDGKSILALFRGGPGKLATAPATGYLCTLAVEKNETKDCAVCADAFSVGQTIVRLPACGHVFHETCAMQWLTMHNTCPYCRRELPTDDEEYERERRREQRTHAGSQGSGEGRGADVFYG